MRAILIGLCLGVGWLAVSFLTENLFPVGDWRWGIMAALFFLGGGVVWLWPSKNQKRLAYRKADERRLAKLKPAWHEALERCHAAFIEYMKVPASRPISTEQIVATQSFLPHVEELCRCLDEHEIPHPDISGGLIFDHTGKWGRFMAKLLAVQGDLTEAKQVLAKMADD